MMSWVDSKPFGGNKDIRGCWRSTERLVSSLSPLSPLSLPSEHHAEMQLPPPPHTAQADAALITGQINLCYWIHIDNKTFISPTTKNMLSYCTLSCNRARVIEKKKRLRWVVADNSAVRNLSSLLSHELKFKWEWLMATLEKKSFEVGLRFQASLFSFLSSLSETFHSEHSWGSTESPVSQQRQACRDCSRDPESILVLSWV